MARRQKRFDGMEPINDKALREAAEDLRAIRTARMAKQKEEAEAQDKVLGLMHDRKEEVVELSGGIVVSVLAGREKVKVKATGEDDDREADEDAA